MNPSIFRFSLDFHSVQSQVSIPVFVGDTSVSLRISLSDGVRAYVIEDGCLAKLSIKRPTGTHLEEFCTIENNTTIVYDFSQNENTCAVEGIHECDVVLYGLDGKIVGSPRFTMVVNERVIKYDDIILTDEDHTAMDAVLIAEASRQVAEEHRTRSEAERVSNEEERKKNEGKLKDAVEKAEEAKDASKASEDAAKESETNAKTSEANAKTSEANAKTSEDNAKASENIATASAEIARQFASHTENIEAQISRNDKRLTNLEQGLPEDNFMVDESVAYTKDVPANAMPYAELHKVGGMTYRDEITNTLKHSKVTEVESVGGNIFGGDALKDKFKAEMANATVNSTDKTIDYAASEASGKTFFSNFKPNTRYTFIFKVAGSNKFINLAVTYTDGSMSEAFKAPENNADPFVFVSDATKSVRSLIGYYSTARTVLYYNDCGIFEGVLTADDFKPYVKHTLPIPAEVRNLEGYGFGVNADCYNYIDLDNNQYVKRVAIVDMGTLSWTLGNNNVFYVTIADKASGFNILQPLYEKIHTGGTNSMPDKSVSVNDVYDFIYVRDTSYTDAATFKNAMSGVMLCYEIKTPIVTDISDILTADNMLSVEGNGLLTFVNEHGQAVPSTVEYQLEV